MKRALVVCVLLAVLCQLFGCVGGAPQRSYISGVICCELSWEMDKKTYRAELEREESFIRICFSEPSSLCGLEVVRDAERVRATLYGVEINADGIEGLLEIGKLFEYDTRVVSSALDGAKETLTLERASGERFLLYVEEGVPTLFECELYGETKEVRLIRVEGDMLGR